MDTKQNQGQQNQGQQKNAGQERKEPIQNPSRTNSPERTERDEKRFNDQGQQSGTRKEVDLDSGNAGHGNYVKNNPSSRPGENQQGV